MVRIVAAALCVLFLSGCARQLTRIETKLDGLAQEQAAQRAAQEQLETELAAIRDELGTAQASDRERWAALNSRLDQVERSSGQLSANSEEQQQLFRQLRSALELVERGGTPTEASSSDEAESLPDPSGSAGLEVFDAAMADFTRGSYTLARQGFQEVIDRFPNTDLALQSEYWVAETYYNQESYGEAYRRFDRVLAASPSSESGRKSMLKMGYCLLELDDRTRARGVLERLVREHPDSEEALIAESRLSTLNPSP